MQRPTQHFAPADVVAGVSVAFLLIPQALAYAKLAGLPPHAGLYASVLPLIVAAFFASSPYLQTGPSAMTSLLTFGALAPLVAPGSTRYIALAGFLAVVVGVVRVSIGAARFGWVAYVMSQPVLKGFMTAAAVLIIASQLPAALGTEVSGRGLIVGALWAVAHPATWNLVAIVLAAVTMTLVLGGSRLHRLFPGVLVAVVLGLAVGTLCDYEAAVVGAIPSGLPPISLALPWRDLPALLVPGVVIAVVGFAEPAAIARTFAAEQRQRWDPNREFVSQGVASLAAGVSGGFPVGGSFGRTTVNKLSGGRTRWSGAVTGVVVGFFLMSASVVERLPLAVLSAIVIAAVIRLVDFRSLIELTRLARAQAAVGWATFGFTLLLSPRIDQAVIIGVAMAIVAHLWRELRVHVQVDYHEGTLRLCPQGVLFFASAPWVDQALADQLAAHPDAQAIEIDLSRLGRIDYTGATVLRDVASEAIQAGLTVRFVSIPPQAQKIVRRVVGDWVTS